MKKVRLLLLFVFVAFCTSSVFAYDVIGHRIIAEIAYKNLTKKARKQVDDVLGRRGIIYTSSWADNIKSDNKYSYSYAWHYQDLDPGFSDQKLHELIDNPTFDGEHLFLAIPNMEKRLKTNLNDKEALMFLVHLVGDLHQPLHLGHKDDMGGNKTYFTWFGKKVKIHYIWDTLLIDALKMSSSEYAQFLEDKFAGREKEFMKYSFFDSVKASYDTANKIYAYDMSDTNTFHYIYYFEDDINTMLYRAGIQLAVILNNIYK